MSDQQRETNGNANMPVSELGKMAKLSQIQQDVLAMRGESLSSRQEDSEDKQVRIMEQQRYQQIIDEGIRKGLGTVKDEMKQRAEEMRNMHGRSQKRHQIEEAASAEFRSISEATDAVRATYHDSTMLPCLPQ